MNSDTLRGWTLDEVAQRLSVSRRTIERLIERGELRAIRLGRNVRVLERHIEEWASSWDENLEEQEIQEPAPEKAIPPREPPPGESRKSLIELASKAVEEITRRGKR